MQALFRRCTVRIHIVFARANRRTQTPRFFRRPRLVPKTSRTDAANHQHSLRMDADLHPSAGVDREGPSKLALQFGGQGPYARIIVHVLDQSARCHDDMNAVSPHGRRNGFDRLLS